MVQSTLKRTEKTGCFRKVFFSVVIFKKRRLLLDLLEISEKNTFSYPTAALAIIKIEFRCGDRNSSILFNIEWVCPAVDGQNKWRFLLIRYRKGY